MEFSNSSRKGHAPYIPNDLLNDLSSRFIINVPEEERVDLIRLCFQIELAHWFYLDFYCEDNPKLPKVALKDFLRIIFGHIPFLKKYSSTEVDGVIADWREYKKAVPTYGAILLDEELKNVLLVQGFVYKANWGFPKGKVNKDEQPHHCAIREVLEETGFDITHLLNKEQYLEHYLNDQLIRLYIITGVPHNANFHPKTRNEIKGCEWFAVNQLPVGRKDPTQKNNANANSFFMVIPFVKPLKKWIANRDKRSNYLQEKALEVDKQQVLKQQELFAQLTKNDFARYLGNSLSEEKTNRQIRTGYSLPPRMLRQLNVKGDPEKRKSVCTNSQLEERIAVPSKHLKPITDFPKSTGSSQEDHGSIFPIAETWKNFSLDCEALVATFNINLKKTFFT